MKPSVAIRAEALGLVRDQSIPKDWSDFLADVLDNVDYERVKLDWDNPKSLPRQLRNPSVVSVDDEGNQKYLSSQIWLAIDKGGKKQLIIPSETSGVLVEDKTGRILKNFSGLPEVTPDGTEYLIRITLRKEKRFIGEVPDMKWVLYSSTKS